MKTMMIPTKIAYHSCIGTSSTFPRGKGNYMGTTDNQNTYVIMNLSAEDLEDLISLKLIDDKQMEAIVYTLDTYKFMAYIIDKRIPKECLTPFWTYECNNDVVNQFIRDFHNVPTDKCICEIDVTRKWAGSAIISSQTYSKYKCRECKTETFITKPGWHDIDKLPYYFEGIKKFKVIVSQGSMSPIEVEKTIFASYRFHDYKRWNKDAVRWHTGDWEYVLKWQYMEQED